VTPSFQLRWSVTPLARARPDEDLVDASELFVCLRRYLRSHHGTFSMRFNGVELQFDMDPDLSTVFEELPGILDAVAEDTNRPVDLYFFEQGTDLHLELDRRGDDLVIWPKKGPSAGKRFERIAERPHKVSGNEFVGEWLRFLGAILDALVCFEPLVERTPSYRSYSGRLAALRRRVAVPLCPDQGVLTSSRVRSVPRIVRMVQVEETQLTS